MTRLSRSQQHQTITGSPALLLWLCMQSLQHRRSGADEPISLREARRIALRASSLTNDGLRADRAQEARILDLRAAARPMPLFEAGEGEGERD